MEGDHEWLVNIDLKEEFFCSNRGKQ